MFCTCFLISVLLRKYEWKKLLFTFQKDLHWTAFCKVSLMPKTGEICWIPVLTVRFSDMFQFIERGEMGQDKSLGLWLMSSLHIQQQKRKNNHCFVLLESECCPRRVSFVHHSKCALCLQSHYFFEIENHFRFLSTVYAKVRGFHFPPKFHSDLSPLISKDSWDRSRYRVAFAGLSSTVTASTHCSQAGQNRKDWTPHWTALNERSWWQYL